MPRIDCTTIWLHTGGPPFSVNVVEDIADVALKLHNAPNSSLPWLLLTGVSGDRVYLPSDVIEKVLLMHTNTIEVRDPRIALAGPSPN